MDWVCLYKAVPCSAMGEALWCALLVRAGALVRRWDAVLVFKAPGRAQRQQTLYLCIMIDA